MNSFLALNDLMWTPILRKFPDLIIALSEGGIGWIPYALERMDYTYSHHKAWTGADFGGLTPTENFRRNFSTCFIDDNAGIALRHKVGIDRMTWECDYPHSDSTWPHSATLLAHSLEGVPDDEIDKITHLNTMKLYSFDPFATRPREVHGRGAQGRRCRRRHLDQEHGPAEGHAFHRPRTRRPRRPRRRQIALNGPGSRSPPRNAVTIHRTDCDGS